ncbi:DUF6745 domain-containing protein [Streptomyces sp. NPDC020731]|uniref:DUF6745 domain-containing protein n=1 Tax=Streptomyces sp. NPDC020731 TaxID=3365085 RepID=UPI0037A220B3
MGRAPRGAGRERRPGSAAGCVPSGRRCRGSGRCHGTGTFRRAGPADDEPVGTAEVLDSAPGPDGTHRTYRPRVPPTPRTAREGVAGTFGPGAEVYEPPKGTRAPARPPRRADSPRRG